jgi:hypothetical protein
MKMKRRDGWSGDPPRPSPAQLSTLAGPKRIHRLTLPCPLLFPIPGSLVNRQEPLCPAPLRYAPAVPNRKGPKA